MSVRESIDIGYGRKYENTSGYLMADGWRKTGMDHGSYEHAYLFNVNTGETASVCVYDWDEPRNEDLFWYYVGIDNDARIARAKKFGTIIDGLMAKVVKGRKVPIGFSGKVVKIRRVYDRYDRWVANYVVFEDGTSTNIANCVLDEEE